MCIKNAGVVVFLSVILFLSCKDKASDRIDPGGTPKPTPPPSRTSTMATENGGLFLPDGFVGNIVHDSVGPSRHLAVNENGDIYVKLRIPTGTKGNVALRDTTGDGHADRYERFGDYPNDGGFATEMRIYNGYLYFSSEQIIYRQKLSPDHLVPQGPPEVVLTDQFPKRWHNAKSLAFDHEGHMYVTFSAPTNACEDSNAKGKIVGMYPCPGLNVLGSIWRFDAGKLNQTQQDGSMYALGLRSIVAISWHDDDNSLYAVQHGRDYLHNHAPEYYSEWEQAILPAEELMKIEEGDNFGWPYTYYDQFKHKRMLAPEYGGDGKKVAEGYAEPLMGLPAHWAPNDLLFYKGNQFPARYKNGAFIAFHGSVNRSPYPQAGYIVAFVPFANGKPTGKWEVFADGFTGVDTVKTVADARFRPMGLAEGPNGSLFVSDSNIGRIWRISYKGDPASFDESQLSAMEKRKSRSYLKMPDERTGRVSD